jgi:hypothetical protein
VFPDDESLVQGEFEKNLPFALDLAKSAANPGQPVSHLGNTVKPFYLDMGKDGKARTGPTRRRRTTPRSTSRSPSRTATRSRCGCSPSAT